MTIAPPTPPNDVNTPPSDGAAIVPRGSSQPFSGVSDRSATEIGENYDEAVNNRRRTLAVCLLIASAFSFAGMLCLIILITLGTVSAVNIGLPMASLAAITIFFVSSARRDLIPYQFLHQPKDTGPQDPIDRGLAAAEQLGKALKEAGNALKEAGNALKSSE